MAAAAIVQDGRVLLVRRRVAEGARPSPDGPGGPLHACRPVDGEAVIASADEVADLAWAAHGEIPQYVPYGLFEPVRNHLDAALLP
ncbi:hypothetical protein OG611_23495 [Streptomyces sp. NBC_01363]|nr:hypothetical protein [Streptomyces sp. NBC_01363]